MKSGLMKQSYFPASCMFKWYVLTHTSKSSVQIVFSFYIITIITALYINLWPDPFYTGVYIMLVAFESREDFGPKANLTGGNSFY